MSEPTAKPSSGSAAEGSEKPQPRIVNPQDLVYISSFSESEDSISDDPREIVNNPAVAPQTLDTTPENLRDDFFKQDAEG